MTADHVESHSTGGMTSYTITGSREFIQETIEQIERQYHPLGYGTAFHPPTQQPDGSWLCFGSRANSCD